jgi:hypothetical protein
MLKSRIERAVFLLIFVVSCANPAPPNGGEKDTKPPKLVNATPPLFHTNFKGREFVLEFDELFILDNIRQQLIVSPPLAHPPEIKVKKKSIWVTFFEDELIPNTTYTFNFGSAIKDNNEGNVLPNFSYVFSTGDYIDSLSIKGRIFDAFTHEPVELVSAMLYNTLEDSLPLSVPPLYLSKTDKNGEFELSNLAAGYYKFFALEDQNVNYIYDQPNERIGYTYQILDASDLRDKKIEIPIFLEDKGEQYITTQKIESYGFITLTFNRPLKRFDYQIMERDERDEPFLFKMWPGRDTVQFWFPDYEEEFEIKITDGEDFTDTLAVRIQPIFELLSPPDFNVNMNTTAKMDLGKPIRIDFGHPIVDFSSDKIQLYEDSLKVPIQPVFKDSSRTVMEISYNWKEGGRYLLVIGIGALTDFYGLTNDLIEKKFGAQEETYYGTIKLLVNVFEKEWPYRLELIDKNNEVILHQNIFSSGSIVFRRLPPATYRIRIIEDVNENGKWDPGEYSTGRFPEPIYYFPEEIQVRSNWELEQTWNLPDKEYR